MNWYTMKHLALLALICSLLLACAQPSKDDYTPSGLSAEQLFNNGEQAMLAGDYGSAITQFASLQAEYPFDKHAEQAQLNIIYAYYRKDDQASTVAASERFIHLYPRSPHVDYAYYMKGVANFSQERGILLQYLPIDISERDPGTSLEAYQDFTTLLRRFPKSRYAADAHQRMIFLRNMFAQKELNSANFYLKHRAYVAAANRASYIVENYQQAPQVKQALIILVKANRAMHLTQSADEAERVLQMNFPGTKT